MNVVVVTSDPVLISFLQRPLAPLGHQLVAVPRLADLRTQSDSGPLQAVLVPRRLPAAALAGLDEPLALASGERLRHAVGWLRARLSDEVGIIVVSPEPTGPQIARDAGADGCLLAPFSDAEVLEILGTTSRERKLILLADDSPLIHRHIRPILEENGYEVVSARDGLEALRLCRERDPDLVITDVEMPGLDGYALCKAIKHEWPHLPVLISSTLGDATDLERGFDAGADDYLVKPVMPEELLTRVHILFPIPGARERILVVDDSPAQRHYVADCLTRQGFAVSTAEHGRAGLEQARRLQPALVISDYEMPEMNGFELVHALKRDPETRNIPVIMLTARDSKRDMAQMRAAGASAYLVKPFATDKCIATVERTLAERRLLDYKQASSVYISRAARRAAEARVRAGDVSGTRADEREMAVLFSDIAGFTRMSATLSPRQVIDLLNDYFDRMCPAILSEQGDIDKFLGDGIMAVFDEVTAGEAPAARAVRAALAMQEAMAAFNAGRAKPLQVRIGINTGPLVRGDLGARGVRRDYTVIGDTVNRAQRYESASPPGRVLISQSTRDQLGDLLTVEPRPGLQLKGVTEPVTGYVVVAMAPRPEEA